MTTGNQGLDVLADAIAARVVERMRSPDDIRLLTIPAAARYLGRSPRAIRYLIAKGSFSAVMRGRNLRLDRVELDAWIEAGKIKVA